MVRRKGTDTRKILQVVLISSIIIVGTICMYGFREKSLIKENIEVYREYDIVALSLKTDIEGSFFLGCGKINEDLIYYYMVNTKYGHQTRWVRDTKLWEKERNRATVFVEEKKDTEPKLYIMKRVRTYKFGNEISDFVAFPLLANYSVDYFYKFVVPEGSICRDFNIALEDL